MVSCNTCEESSEEKFKKKKNKQFYKSCIDCNEKQKKKRWNDPTETRMRRIIYNSKVVDARKKMLDLNNHVDLEYINQLQFESGSRCVYCLAKVSLNLSAKNNHLLTLDRIYNEVGHIKSNVQIACFSCNMARGNNWSFREFKDIIQLVKSQRVSSEKDSC
jgi:biotin synthase-like enzyme